MKSIVYVDIEAEELRAGRWRIVEIGAVRDGGSFRSGSMNEWTEFASGADQLIGHNIVQHDLPLLQEAGWQMPPGCTVLDTLCLSALLFPEKPFHALQKTYQNGRATVNDPVADARICEQLFSDLNLRWKQVDANLQQVWSNLLYDHPGFLGFWNVQNRQFRLPYSELVQQVESILGDQVCRNQNLQSLVSDQPHGLAFALAQIVSSDGKMALAPWVLHQYPRVQDALFKLRSSSCQDPGCSYCRKYLDPVAALNQYFGFSGFRKFEGDGSIPLQEQVVESALDRQSLVAVFPTGGGKSLTFQLPALMNGVAQQALTVVISPLQSLMKDQVDVLQSRHDILKAVTINGLLSPLERDEAEKRIRAGEVSLLYLSPESLRSKSITRLLQDRHIDRFVIDEAHCFSSWGQDFRTDYLYIARFIRKLQEAKNQQEAIPVSCFTATARPAVIDDIRNYLGERLGLDTKLFRTFQTRPNLNYEVLAASGDQEKQELLLELLGNHQGATIIYASRTRKTEEISTFLNAHGYATRHFHGKLDRKTKMENQDAFMRGEVDVMVATTAFGMGVDKDNVEVVIHYNISDSLENYLQESGRAGRKRDLQAYCYVLFDEQDLSNHFALLNTTRLNQKEVAQIWRAVKYFGKEIVRKSALEIASKAGWDTEIRELEVRVKAALAALEEKDYLLREENDTRVFATSILARSVEEANAVIEEHADRWISDELMHAKRIFQHIISRQEVRAEYVADRLDLPVHFVARCLRHFHQLGLIGNDTEIQALAFKGTGRSKDNAVNILTRFLHIEQRLFEQLFAEGKRQVRVGLRQVNQDLLDEGLSVTISDLRDVLNYWSMTHLIRKNRLDAQHWLYKITLRKPLENVREQIENRSEHAVAILNVLFQRFGKTIRSSDKSAGRTPDTHLLFTISRLKKAMQENELFQLPLEEKDYERLILFFNFLHVLDLERGLLIFYMPMRIQRLKMNNRLQYTKEDHEFLEAFYQRKVQQIHIVGEYARLALKDRKRAQQFSADYFRLDYQTFINSYFKDRKGIIKRAVTESQYRQLFDRLNEQQQQVVRDKNSERILVAAGPGSGKTRILVHKVAALLWLEDVKPEQFLMLTFSRPAANEFKERLYQMIGDVAWHIDIHTYHSYAFHLLGQMGNLEKATDVIPQAVAAIREGKTPLEKVNNKSVLVIDEYQDINGDEFELIEEIIQQAEKLRVIAVGDDDQNIYEFRGSSVKYMRDYQQKAETQTYYLQTNFRSGPNLVDYANAFLSQMRSDRVKQAVQLEANETRPGILQLREYTHASNFLIPFVEAIANRLITGSTGVLTATNEDAMLIHNQLVQRGVPARLVREQGGFRLGQLLELQFLSYLFAQQIDEEHDRISEETWEQLVEKAHNRFQESTQWWLASLVIEAYESANKWKRYEAWRLFLYEARTEDFLHAQKGQTLVTTYHKAKGKEFDRVFLHYHPKRPADEAAKRALYVAITRARSELHMHTSQVGAALLSLPDLPIFQDGGIYAELATLWFEATMKDVYLSYFEKEHIIRAVKPLISGTELEVISEAAGQFGRANQTLSTLSQKGKDELSKLINKGYSIQRVTINYLVRWKSKNPDSQEVTVVLPLVELRR